MEGSQAPWNTTLILKTTASLCFLGHDQPNSSYAEILNISIKLSLKGFLWFWGSLNSVPPVSQDIKPDEVIEKMGGVRKEEEAHTSLSTHPVALLMRQGTFSPVFTLSLYGSGNSRCHGPMTLSIAVEYSGLPPLWVPSSCDLCTSPPPLTHSPSTTSGNWPRSTQLWPST